MWKGKEIPKEIKKSDFYDLWLRQLGCNINEDVNLINDYCTKLDEKDKVQGRFTVDCSYFN